MSDPDCLFCRFVAGDPTPDVVHETATTLAFRDINPQAPTHVLVVPKAHHRDAAALAAADPAVMADLIAAAAEVAEPRASTTATASCSTPARGADRRVFHVHLHVLGGRALQLAARLSRNDNAGVGRAP